MRRRPILALLVLVILGLGAFWALTRPRPLADDALAGIAPDPARGEYVFRAGGCASCHAAKGATGAGKLKLTGGQAFASAFGTFYAPNISPDPVNGIGRWSDLQFVNAVTRGIGPEGRHLYPALPYPAYIHMTLADAMSLRAYLATLPAQSAPSTAQQVRFPYGWRRLLGGWKLMNLHDDWAVDPVPPEAVQGRYIAEALAHCGECHTPRNATGGLDRGAWLTGAPNPAGKGTIPDITPARLKWSEADMVAFFQTGLTPDYDSAGGSMAEVIENLSTLPEADLVSLAAYLKAVPAK